jgi:membrane associated rhomboid family serine protease
MFSVTVLIIAITVGLSIYAFERSDVMSKLIFNPYVINVRKQWHRFITHGFIHADYMHLAVNMFVLFFFGRVVESSFIEMFGAIGIVGYILLYVSAIGIASISSYMKYKNSPNYNSLGASGATSAVLYASILLNPWGELYLYFIPLPGIVFGVLYLVYSSYMGKRGGDYINHDAHIYGAIFGFLYPILIKPQLAVRFVELLLGRFGITF